MSPEEWRPVLGWEGLYEVSNLGRVRSLPRVRCKGGVLGHGTTQRGYLNVNLWRDGKRQVRTVHRVVAEAFLGPKPEELQTCHNDGNKLNNAATNLRYDTASENQLDRVRHGTHNLANRTHCPAGHEYTPENTKFGKGGRWRSCRACRRDRQRAT